VRVPEIAAYKGLWMTAEPDDDNPAWSRTWIFKARFS